MDNTRVKYQKFRNIIEFTLPLFTHIQERKNIKFTDKKTEYLITYYEKLL